MISTRRHDVRYSTTARKNRAIQRAIDAIGEHDWIPIPYWLDGGADVAETTYTAFAGTRDETTARLIVRRVRPTPGSQLALDVVFSYHAILTDRDGPLLEIEADHGRHAIVEYMICDLKPRQTRAPTLRAVRRQRRIAVTRRGRLQPREVDRERRRVGRVTTKTLQLTVIAVPARLITSGRRTRLRMPTAWPWVDHITAVLDTIGRLEPAPG